MSCPITGSSFTVASLGQSFCDRITNLLALSAKIKTLLDWMFDSDGNANQEFASMFQLPPGTIIAWYSSITNEEAAAKAVRELGRTQVDIDAHDAQADATKALWLLCDGTQGTPDLRGRMVIGAGLGSGLTARTVNVTGGAEQLTFTEDMIPAHGHVIKGRMKFAAGKDTAGQNDFGAVRSWEGPGDGVAEPVYTFSSADTSNDYLHATNTGSEDEVKLDIMPPHYALYYIMRTSRNS